jgi:hypothetical protein
LNVESFSVPTRFKVRDLDTCVSHELLGQVEQPRPDSLLDKSWFDV